MQDDNQITISEYPPDFEPQVKTKSFQGIDATELANYVLDEPDWIVDHVIARGQPTTVGARSKAGKTTQLADLAVSLTSKTKWLNYFNVSTRRKVLFITGESDYSAISKRINRALTVRGLTFDDVAGWLRVEAVEFPKLSIVSDLLQIADDVAQNEIQVVILDPLYRGLPGLDTARMAEMGDAIIQFTQACKPADPFFSHHVTKSSAKILGPPELEDLSGGGLAESCGNWWLLGRMTPYKFDGMHDLCVTYGGRAEQAGIRRIVFDEPSWHFDVQKMQDFQEEQRRQKDEQKENERQRKLNQAKASIKHCLAQITVPKPKSWIESRSTGSREITRRALAEMLTDGTLVEAPYQDSKNRTQTGLLLKSNSRTAENESGNDKRK